MKIVLFHPVLLPPKDYGGVERVVLWLARGLVEAGHDVWVGAHPGSRLPEGVRLLEVAPDDASALSVVKRLPPGTDVVHFMAPPELETWEQLPCAGILTVHGNGKPGETFPPNTVFLSRDHARRHGGTAFVHNGIDPVEYRFEPELKEDRPLFLSKTSWKVKNLRGAMAIGRHAGHGLRIAGGNRPLWARLSVLFSPGFSWEGPVSGGRKAGLLARASALVFPVIWPEPFGLVVAEALMSGTPVLASPLGSLPELVPADVGALISPEKTELWIEAVRDARSKWNPERCRQWAMEKFHYNVMTRNYLEYYGRILGGESIHDRTLSTG